MKQIKLNIHLISFLMMAYLAGCIGGGGDGTGDGCDATETFDPETRSCVVTIFGEAPPTNTLTVVNMTEDDAATTINLTYTDINDDIATSCNIPTDTNVTSGACGNCTASYCQVAITPDADFCGTAFFDYTVTDNDGASTQTTVSVIVACVDDAPTADLVNSDPSGLDLTDATGTPFQEDEFYSLTNGSDLELGYDDVDGDTPTLLQLTNFPSAYLEVPGICTDQGGGTLNCTCVPGGIAETCAIDIEPIDDINTAVAGAYVPQSFDYAVQTNGVLSTAQTISFDITAVNDAPLVNNIDFDDMFDEDVLLQQRVTLDFSDAETTNFAAFSCAAVASGTAYFDVVACSCDAVGCYADINLVASGTYDHINSDITDMELAYTVTDDGLDNGIAAASAPSNSAGITVEVEAVNDAPYWDVFAAITDNGSAGGNGDFQAGGASVAAEDTTFIISSVAIDEGGPSGVPDALSATDEDAQSILVKVTTSDQTVVKDTSVVIKYNGVDLNYDGVTAVDILDGASDAQAYPFAIELTPEPNAATVASGAVVGGNFYITVELDDGIDTTLQDVYIDFVDQNDYPTGFVSREQCKFDLDECDGGNFCRGASDPTGVVTPDDSNVVFYDATNEVCYYSTGTTNADWTAMSDLPNCPISFTESVTAGCSGGSCLGAGSPAGVISPGAIDKYYFDTSAEQCYRSTGTGSTEWITYNGEEACEYSSDQCDSGSTCTGTSTPVGSITPDDYNAIFFDSSNRTCYYSTGTTNADWVQFQSKCKITDSTTEAQCASLDGNTSASCLGTENPADIPITGTDGSIFYDRVGDQCYKRIGGVWEQYGAFVEDQEINEAGVAIINLDLDEGFAAVTSNEESQNLCVSVTTNSTTLLPSQNIIVKRDQVELGDADGTVYNFADGTADAATFGKLVLEARPVAAQSGTATITVTVADDHSVAGDCASTDLSTTFDFDIQVNPVGAIHGGWSNVIAIGPRENRNGEIDAGKEGYIKIDWNNFTLAGSGAGAGASISGWNIYRRQWDESFNFQLEPLNGDTPITAATTEYTDEIIDPGTVYYYVVRPVDSIFGVNTSTQESFDEIRVMAPPANKTLAHRWIINQEICGNMSLTVNGANNYRCQYTGPGEKVVNNVAYYDIGTDLLVDTYEAGCPFSEPDVALGDCGANGCIGQTTPGLDGAVPTAGLVYYNRSTGICYRADGASWNAIGVNTISTANLSAEVVANDGSSIKDNYNRPGLPPLVHMEQDVAYEFCSNLPEIDDIDGIIGDSTAANEGDLNLTLPSRKHQMAYSAWDDSITDFIISSTEQGLSLSASSKCNSTSANGLANNYTDSDMPISAFIYTIPGTFSSGIRSVATGSDITEQCVSRYGVQDSIGNVNEWTSDRIFCDNNNIYDCLGVHSTTNATYQLDANNNDMDTIDGTFIQYGFDGFTGPCDLNGQTDGDCTPGVDVMDEWEIKDKTFDSFYFLFPLGLPVDQNASLGNVTALQVGLGPLSTLELHGDYYILDTDKLYGEACDYWTQAEEPNCPSGGCTDASSPVELAIIPSALGAVFYDSDDDLCYVATDTMAASDWNAFTVLDDSAAVPTTDFAGTWCPVGTEDTACNSLGGGCIASGAAHDPNTLGYAPNTSDVVYFLEIDDGGAEANCFAWDGVDSWNQVTPGLAGMLTGGGYDSSSATSNLSGSRAGRYSLELKNPGHHRVDVGFRCISEVRYHQCRYWSLSEIGGTTTADCTTAGCTASGPPTVDPGMDFAVYLDTGSQDCYYWDSATWQSFESDCPISTGDVCDTGANEGCIDSATPVGTYTPSAPGLYYLDVVADQCYISIGTTNADWQEHTP